MAGENQLTVVGNLTADPELKFTNNGAAVAAFTVASTPRIFDKKSNEWRDGEALFLRCTVWREHAEHVAASLVKGQRVVVVGILRQKSWETKEGERRTSYELDVQEVGPALRYGAAQFTRSQDSQGGSRAPGGSGTGSRSGGGVSSPQNGGWADPEAPF